MLTGEIASKGPQADRAGPSSSSSSMRSIGSSWPKRPGSRAGEKSIKGQGSASELCARLTIYYSPLPLGIKFTVRRFLWL